MKPPSTLHGPTQIPYSSLHLCTPIIHMQDFTTSQHLRIIWKVLVFVIKLVLLLPLLQCILKLILFVLLRKTLLDSIMESQILSKSSWQWCVVSLLYRARFQYRSCSLSGVFPAWISCLVSLTYDTSIYMFLPVTLTHHMGAGSFPHSDINGKIQSPIHCDLEVCTDHCAVPASCTLPVRPSLIELNHC